MAIQELKIELVEADVLCVGGGPAGLCAAIRASELGAKVVVVDKSNTMRSGDAGMGNDHFRCYMPDVHGEDINTVLKEASSTQVGAFFRSQSFARTFWENSYDMVKHWESYGIPMKYEGRYVFAGHGYPGRPRLSLHYSGQDTKPALTRYSRRLGAKIINRVMVFDLLAENGTVYGALGIDVREPRLLVFKSSAVVLTTGKAMRVYPGITPASLFNTNTSPTSTGDGRAMAFRAGCELTNLELSAGHAGPKYWARNGKGSWMGVLRDSEGRPIGPFITEPNIETGDMTSDFYKNIFRDYAASGRGPVYMDLTGMSNEDYEHMRYWLVHEGNVPLLDHMAAEGRDPLEHPIEFTSYPIYPSGGMYYNEKCEVLLKGLYAAGDEYGIFAIPGAAVFGRIAGESAASYAKSAERPARREMQAKVDESKHQLESILGRESGATWEEANIALQQVMGDYCGLVRSENLLEAGVSHLWRLKKKARETIFAHNPHELMRSLEVLNLLDIGELIFVAAKERKETRGNHKRVDYPYTNPLLNDKVLTVQNVNGTAVAVWKDVV